MKYIILLLIITFANAKSTSDQQSSNYSVPAFIEYDKNAEIKHNNDIVLRNINDAVTSFNNFDILIYYHDDKSYYYALEVKQKIKQKLPVNAAIKISLCGHGCYYEKHYSYIPHGVAILYKDLCVSNTTAISRKLAITNK
jgi:hypothetical protein